MSEILRTLAERIDPAHTAILAVDMQNDFCAEGGYAHQTRKGDMSFFPVIAERITALVDVARDAGVSIVWVKANYEPRFLSAQALLKREERGGAVCCAGGSWGWDFFAVAPKADDLVVEKHAFSAFAGTDLDRTLRSRGIKTLVMTGVATNVCVESTLREGFMLGYYIVLAEDCCHATVKALHDATVANVRNSFGEVVQADALSSVWSSVGRDEVSSPRAFAQRRQSGRI